MKRRILYLTLAMMLALPLTACGESEQTVTTSASNGQTTEQTPPPIETVEPETTEPEAPPVEDTASDVVEEDKGEPFITLFDGTELYREDFTTYEYWYATGETGTVLPITISYTGTYSGKEISIPIGQGLTTQEILDMNGLEYNPSSATTLYELGIGIDLNALADIFEETHFLINCPLNSDEVRCEADGMSLNAENASEILGTPSYIAIQTDYTKGWIDSEIWAYDSFFIRIYHDTDTHKSGMNIENLEVLDSQIR